VVANQARTSASGSIVFYDGVHPPCETERWMITHVCEPQCLQYYFVSIHIVRNVVQSSATYTIIVEIDLRYGTAVS
jgi:hypothetical protein